MRCLVETLSDQHVNVRYSYMSSSEEDRAQSLRQCIYTYTRSRQERMLALLV